MTTDFSSETMEAKRKWHNIFQELKEKNCQLGILYPVKISFRKDGGIKTFSDTGTLKEFITRRPALKNIAQGHSSDRR